MYAMVFFFLVFTSMSLFSCSSSDIDQEIFMVLDEETLNMHPVETGIIKVSINISLHICFLHYVNIHILKLTTKISLCNVVHNDTTFQGIVEKYSDL